MEDAVNFQYQVRQNSDELQDFLKDLYKWEDEVQTKDKFLVNSKSPGTSSHPVRNKKKKKKPKSILKQTSVQSKPRLKGSDFQAWDKYNVDEALKEIDNEEDRETRSSSEEDSEDEELAEHRRLQQALFEKEKGNDLFKEGKYEAAINRYTSAIALDPYNAILPANRAMALIKVCRYGAAIQDCDTALELDSTYVKAYARRATAKQCLQKLNEAIEDYEQLLVLQPGNKQALDGIEKIKMMLANQHQENTTVKEQLPTVELLKKPMKRYVIEEIGTASSDEEDVNIKQSASFAYNTSLVETQHFLPNEASRETVVVPIKTVGENTENSKTIEDHNHLTKPANGDEHSSTTSQHSSKPEHSKNFTVHSNDSQTELSSHAVAASERCNGVPVNLDLVAPISSIQFQTTWKRLEKSPDLLYSYMKVIPPDRLPKVLGESVESTFLMKIFSILRDYYIRDSRPVFNELKFISQTKRFSMTLMFLSATERLVINGLFDYLARLPEGDRTFTEKELQDLKIKYNIR